MCFISVKIKFIFIIIVSVLTHALCIWIDLNLFYLNI